MIYEKQKRYVIPFDDVPAERAEMPEISVEERKLNYDEVETGFPEDVAVAEAKRCLQCGDCSDLGVRWGCDENLTCVDACADAQCGIVNGVDCGDCSDRGETFGCDANHVCVEACADAECGTILGVNCGDCAERGAGFACADDNTCQEACAGVECGTVMGIDCGTCEPGFECTSAQVCRPESLPGIEWEQIPAGIFRQGCSTDLDPDCDADEDPQREVELSTFWIMTTEVTLWMYQECVNDGFCSAANVPPP